MLLARATPEALNRQRVVHVNGSDYVLSEYVGAVPVRGYYLEGNELNDNARPQGFLVEQPPGSVTPPHFHEVNQFQVIVGGAGKLGKQDAEPLTIHYAGGHTPYGPIIAGDAGVTYFTLRAAWDPGAKYLPQSKDRLKPVPRRHRLLSHVPRNSADALCARAVPSVETILAPEEDGLAAHVFRLGANGVAETPLPNGGGQYHVVVQGVLLLDGKEMPELSCLFVSSDEPPYQARAGRGGLEMLVLQFPKS
jgi:hypothetical protein